MTLALRWNTFDITVAGNSGDPLSFPIDAMMDYAYILYTVEYTNNRVEKYVIGVSNRTTVTSNPTGVSSFSAKNKRIKQ